MKVSQVIRRIEGWPEKILDKKKVAEWVKESSNEEFVKKEFDFEVSMPLMEKAIAQLSFKIYKNNG